MVPRSRNARGLQTYGPLTSLLPSLRPPQGPDVRLPKIVTFRRGTPQQGLWLVLLLNPVNVHDCVEASAWSWRCGNVEPLKALDAKAAVGKTTLRPRWEKLQWSRGEWNYTEAAVRKTTTVDMNVNCQRLLRFNHLTFWHTRRIHWYVTPSSPVCFEPDYFFYIL